MSNCIAGIAAFTAGRRRDTEELYKAGSDYLQMLGFSNKAEIGRVLDIAMNPKSFFSASGDKWRNANVRHKSHRNTIVQIMLRGEVSFAFLRTFRFMMPNPNNF